MVELTTPPPPPEPSPSWLRRRVLLPLQNLLKQGLTPHQLALTTAVGVAVGVVPVLGFTTLLGTLAAVRLRLNVAAMLLISHLMSPLQLLFMLPLLRFGAPLLGANAQTLTLARVRYLFTHDLGGAFTLLWRAELGALLLWLLSAVPLGFLLYFGARPIYQQLLRKKALEEAEG
ncbi:DUF2062 domain-containing protein [Hymenobacter sp. BT507]|uniref:DUF2062 domain-containing protein n=1 Tax=Hymenobacter citatus TaxID=2763506 RepID=A0ABR7MGK1_9BACT|nr:DUF2062 domain-containing protein [Hymenobacter citatus]MBC6609989.1 DUF2062 domain-containing protein [Hymenobacter citatus]